MNREVFIVKNVTVSDIELKSFGLIIPPEQTVELGNFDTAVLSNEVFDYISNGSLVRIINSVPVDSGSSYYQSTEPYSSSPIITNIINVSYSGSNFTSIQEAIDSIINATNENRYVISVGVGIYTENITMKNFITLKGETNETKIVGNITFNSSSIGNSEIYNIIVQSINSPVIIVNTIDEGNRIYLHGVGLLSIWDNDSSIKSIVDIQSGSLNIMSRSILSLTDQYTGLTDNISTIYYVHGTSKIELISSNSSNYVYEYNNTNNISLYYNTNINTDLNRSFIKDVNVSITLMGNLPINIIKVFNHSGSTSITVVDNNYMDLTSTNDISSIIYIPAYNNYSIPHDVSGSTIGSEIYISFSTITWDQIKIPDNVVYNAVALSEIDYVELLSFVFDTNFDIIPPFYEIDGISSGLTLDISNSWGSYLNSSSIKTYSLEIGDSGNYIDTISNDSGLTSDSSSILPTQQSVKRYVDYSITQISGVTDTISGSTNGLSVVNRIVKLGGNLTDTYTNISGLLNTSLEINPGELYLYAKSGITLSNGSDILVKDSLMKYYSDYSNLFTDYTLVHKKYVDDLSIRFNNYTGTTGLQEITDVNSATTNKSTFSNGIITNDIKQIGDTDIIISNSGTTPIITITSSGYTGFGTYPSGMLHVYGTDIVNDDNNYTRNRIMIDGVADGDKDIILGEEGIPRWSWEIYRGEKGKYLYLYNIDGESNQFAISDTGRIGVNTRSNLMARYVSTISGTTNNGIQISGTYNKNYISIYEVKIDTTSGTTNTFAWRVSKDLGQTYSSWSSSIECSLSPITIDSGVEVTCIQTTGYTVGDTWYFPAFPQSPSGTFVISPNKIYSSIITSDYTSSPINYVDITLDINTSKTGNLINLFELNSNKGAIYFGGTSKINSISVNLLSSGNGITLVVEYWNGTNWIDISVGSDYYIDGTNNFTQKGTINWNISTMNDWISANIPDTTEDYYNLYWVRMRSSSIVLEQPLVLNFSRNGDYRIAATESSYDIRPSFYVDAFGRTSIGGGSIIGTNILQINKGQNIITTTTASNSLVEIDSDDSSIIDLKIKLCSDDSIGGGLILAKSRGSLISYEHVEYGDEIGHIMFRGIVDIYGRTLANIRSTYTGDGFTRQANLIFSTANGSEPIDRMIINESGNTGFGVYPSALIHLSHGTTEPNTSPLKFTDGELLTTPEIGAVEFYNDKWYGTITTGSERRTFAFLESPQFTGTPHLPSGTTFDDDGLLGSFILYSGGTNNTTLLQNSVFQSYTASTDTRISGIENDIVELSGDTSNKLDKYIFYSYTGSTIPWTQVSKSGSSISDLQTRNSTDVTYNNSNWNVTNVGSTLDHITDNLENVLITGRLTPITVLGGLNTKTLWVSGGTGFVNYDNYHNDVTWTTTSFDLTTYSANTYYVYVDNSNVIHVSTTEPSKITNVYLGQLYFDSWYIITIVQSAYVSDKPIYRVADYTVRMGGFIYDNGGSLSATGTTQRVVSTACKVQYGLLDYNLSEISTWDANTFTSSGMYQSSDVIFNVDYHFLISYSDYGKIPNNRYNITTNPSNYLLTGYTLTFTQYSNTVTSTSDLTGIITDDYYIYLENSAYMNPVSSVTWDGGTTTITLDDIYIGPSGSGTCSLDKCLPKLPSGKWVKHLVLRTTANNMAIIYGQKYFDSKDEALSGELPSIPTSLIGTTINIATIVVTSGITDYSQNEVINDIRPLPFTFSGGGGGGGGTATSHGSLTGLLNDDHPQYLLTNGTRDVTGIMSYDSHKTFLLDTNIVDKKYVDDKLSFKLDITDFNTFTGTTLPNSYTSISTFNTFTGTTLPNNYYNRSQIDSMTSGYTTLSVFNSYTASTATDINNRLLISTFNTFTGTTLPNSYTLISTFNTFTGTTLPNNYYNKTEINDFSGDTYNQLSNKANLISPSFSGTPTSTTAAVDSNTTQIATTAFVVGQAANTNPQMNGSVTIGTSLRYARQDHVHASDTSKLNVSDFNTFTGTTLPNNYYNRSQIDSMTSGYTTITTFNTFTGTTLPANYLKITDFNTYTSNTNITLSQKANLTSPAFSGTPTSTTASADSNTTQIATTAYVVGQAANTNPQMNGSVAIGTSLRYARQDHVHPSDTSKLNVSDFNTFTGTTLPDNYYTKPLTDAQFIKGTAVDATNIGNNRPLIYDSISGKIIYKEMLDSPPTVQVRRTTTLSVPATWTNITFDKIDVENKPTLVYRDNINTDRIYVIDSGYYEIKFQTRSSVTTSTTKLSCQFMINDNIVISGSSAFINTYTSEIHPLISIAQTYLTGGSYVVVEVIGSVASQSTLSGDTVFTVTKMDGVVGAQGLTGSGSNIIVKSDGTNVTGTPHSYLNFTGNAVTTTNVGDGSGVTISINESVYGTYFVYTQNLTSTNTTATSWPASTGTTQTKLVINATGITTGIYKLTVSYSINKSATNSDSYVRIIQNGSLIGNENIVRLSNTSNYLPFTKTIFVSLTSGTSYQFALQMYSSSSGTVTMRDANMELIRFN